MSYREEGTLTTDKRTVDESTSWDSSGEWEAYEDIDGVVIEDGTLKLEEINIIDNFENFLYDDEDKTISDYYSGDTDVYQRVTDPMKEGEYALERSNDSRDDIISYENGLEYPEAGDTYRYWFKIQNNQRHSHYFATQDNSRDDCYWIQITIDEFRLRKREGASGSDIEVASQTVSNDDWYEVEIEWGSDGNLTARLFDESGDELVSASGNDTDYTSGGIGWGSGGPDTGTVLTDNCRRV